MLTTYEYSEDKSTHDASHHCEENRNQQAEVLQHA